MKRVEQKTPGHSSANRRFMYQLFGVMSKRGNAYAVLASALLSCQLGCSRGRSVGDTAVGTYDFDRSLPAKLAPPSPVARETLQLKPNRTFSQEMVLGSGETFSATGNWHAEKIPLKVLDGGVQAGDEVWVTLDGCLSVTEGGVVRTTNSFYEWHRKGMDALVLYEGTNKNRLLFRRRAE